MKQSGTDEVPSTSVSPATSLPHHAVSELSASSAASSGIAEELSTAANGISNEAVVVDRRGEHSAMCRWTVQNFPRVKARAVWSKYFEVGGYDCRLLVYPKGDSQALPGYVSIYLQIMDPRGTPSSKWDCFASYRLSIVNLTDESKTIHRDSWHRFSTKKKSHGWCDFTPSSSVLDQRLGYLSTTDSVLITADILILNESVSFTRDSCDNSQQQHASTSFTPSSSMVSSSSPSNSSSSSSLHSSVSSSSSITSSAAPIDVLSGKFTWKVHNFSLFKEMIKTQKIMSPVFPAGECNLRISVYQSCVNGQDYLSMCLESKDTDKPTVASGNAPVSDRSCWCLFRMSVLNQKAGLSHTHRDSYGRFATDNKSGDNTSLGWNDYMKMSDFMGDESGFLVDDTAVFSTSFHVIKEFSSFSKNAASIGGRISGSQSNRKSDGHMGKFTWKIENFTRLKDLLKKRKITGLCIKSRRFQIGNRDCRLIVYPRGQSQPPCHLSVFLEVTDSRNSSSDWSCFVSHRLSVVNQRTEEKSVVKESQNRYSKAAKDWGWREFVTLTNLFGQDSGFLVQDTVIFSAEVLILKETSIMQDIFHPDNENNGIIETVGKKCSFTWKVENFISFKEIMETRKIFSKFFQAGGCELRIGVYESFDTVCIYLESDQSSGTDPDKNFWVRYRIAVVNQKNQSRTVWKESSICTKTWNNSVLQFMKVSDLMEADAGFLVRDCVVFVCEILDCCPWFEFSDLEVLASEDDQDALTTDPDELIDSEDSEGISVDEEDIFRNLLSRAGFHLTYGDNPSQPQVTLREKLLMDAGAIAGFLTGLRVYLDDPVKVKRLLLPTKVSGMSDERAPLKTDDSSPCLMNLLMGVKVLQQAIVDLLLDIMVECCQPSDELLDFGSKLSLDDSPEFPVCERFDCAVQSSSSHAPSEHASFRSKTKWPEQSEELLGLIVNSLRALDGAVPQGCPEPRRRPQSAQKIALVLDKAPNYLHSDLISLVPKVVDQSEHSLAAYDLLHRLRKPDAEPSLRFPVFGVVTQLECDSDVWERILFQSFDLLNDSNDEPLAATIEFVFKAASLCQHLPEAVRAIRDRLKVLGQEVSSCVLNFLCKTVSAWGDVAETFLRDIEADDDFTRGLYYSADEGARDERSERGRRYYSDIYLLLEMLSIPCLAVEVSRMFEISVSRGVFSAQTVATVLERRLVHTGCKSGETCDLVRVRTDDFSLVLGLAETLALSGDSFVKGFVKLLYNVLFKCYPDENHREQMLRRLVNRTVSTSEDNHDTNLYVDVLAVLVLEEQDIVHRMLSLMREVAELANVDRAAIWHQLCACEDEIIRLREDSKSDAAISAQEKSVLTQKLNESEAANSRLKSEMKAESDRFGREKKALAERITETESQVEWARSERDDEIAKLKSENRSLHDRLHEAESQLFQLKSRKRDEMKRVVKEKNALAERLKSAEAARKRFDEELKRLATENVSREEVRQSLEDEIRRLTKTVGQTEEEKREKEEQVARCEAYIDGMDSKLLTCQEYIHSLETSLQEEMTRHAPLYGAGLEALSMSELDTISRIHEEGIRQIHALRLRMGSPPHNHSLYPPSPIPVGLPSQVSNGGASIHNNGQVNGPWFNHP